MSPPKFSSLRSSKRRTASLIPFRDESNLVAFRYEQTVQAQPPIPIPAPRHPPARSGSASLRTISSNPAMSFFMSGQTPPMPPAEEHPALRSDFSSTTDSGDEWKRDSVAPSASSATTIYEEELDTPILYDKELGLELETSSHPATSPAITQSPTLIESPVVLDEDSALAIKELLAARRFECEGPDEDGKAPLVARQLHPRAAPPPPLSPKALRPQDPIRASSELSQPPQSPKSPTTSQRRLGRGFSFRVGSSTRLKKRSMVEMATPLEMGIDGTSSTPKQLGQSFPDLEATSGGGGAQEPEQPTRISVAHGPPSPSSPKRPATNHSAHTPEGQFSPISISIPTDSLLDDDFLTNVTFSKRGSIMFGGKRALSREDMADNDSTSAIEHAAAVPDSKTTASRPTTSPAHTTAIPTAIDATAPATSTTPTTTTTAISAARDDASPPNPDAATSDEPPPAIPRVRVLPADVERESLKVRSLYEAGDAFNWELGAPPSSSGQRLAPTPEDPVQKDSLDTREPEAGLSLPVLPQRTSISAESSVPPPPELVRLEYELAGGAEDWQDIDGADVDRYGFIRPRPQHTAVSLADNPGRQGRATSRRRNFLTTRDPSELNSARVPGRKVSARSLHTQASELSVASRRSSFSTLRQAANLLPHNRDRRRADEAGEMLTHAPGITHIAEDENADVLSETLKQKEWERAEKWRRMAKVIKKGNDGEGMEFEFDPKNPKLVDRTWKGIPDCWRGAAWYSFLASSARADPSAPSEEQLVAEFSRLQSEPCEYDGQIDLDVPRTISQHIMFRRRYRGGQRLLFRVLRAVALYFPDIGYVQGMASLAATLLCYFDEERAFVMMARMWQLRGLSELYGAGFENLLACLSDLETRWLAGKDVATKLSELGIDATAFGTRWYLTLFNLSIPFPAQLRVWDVFLLLGKPAPSPAPNAAAASSSKMDSGKGKSKNDDAATAHLDVLHASATALMDALSETILDSDFDNAMKVLTSWIPVKDEDLLMKVARAELKQSGKHKKKKLKSQQS